MKKYYFLIIVALIFALVLTGCSLLSNIGQAPATGQSGITYLTKGGSSTINLLAGQNIDVGEVQVYNDDTYLYIKYIIDEPGWYLTETHLHVACSEEDIPQNKTGNPTPGKFMHNEEYNLLDYKTVVILDPILLESIGCNKSDEDPAIVIAAHAVVCKLSEVKSFTLVSDTETECAGFTNIDPSVNPLNPLNYKGTWNPAVDLSSPLPGTWYSENTSPFIGAFWISSANLPEGLDSDDQYRLFRDMFEIPAGAVNRQGKLWMSADNDAIAYLDDATNVVGEIENVYTNSPSGNVTPFSVAHYYEFVPGEGLNTLYFVVRNWAWEGGNPTGLLYRLDYNYQLLECESAWGDGDRFVDKGNWATYFSYDVLLETITVNSNGYKICSSVSLQEDKEYILKASGTYTFAPGWLPDAGIADAKYSLRKPGFDNPGPVPDWISGDALASPWTNYLELQVDSIPQDWGSLNSPAHTYSTDYTGDGTSVCFSILDSAYGDNSGFLTVDIYWIP